MRTFEGREQELCYAFAFQYPLILGCFADRSVFVSQWGDCRETVNEHFWTKAQARCAVTYLAVLELLKKGLIDERLNPSRTKDRLVVSTPDERTYNLLLLTALLAPVAVVPTAFDALVVCKVRPCCLCSIPLYGQEVMCSLCFCNPAFSSGDLVAFVSYDASC